MAAPGVPSHWMRRARKMQRLVNRSALGASLARLKARAPCHVLLISDGEAFTSEEQFAPLLRHRSAIAAQTGVLFSFMGLEMARQLNAGQLQGYQAVGLKLSFRTPQEVAEALARHVFDTARRAGARALMFDGDDDLLVLWPGALDACDAWIKKHVLADRTEYEAPLVGKSNLTDYVHRTYGRRFETDNIPSSGNVPGKNIGKIVLGWNIALDDKIADLARDLPTSDVVERDLDLLCRASVPQTAWTFEIRDAAVQAIKELSGQYRIHAPTDRVPQADYYREMLRSRICVSPFGYGELCWRDFEAILCGCLLVKPDMSHLETQPDLFRPHETYVPVKWDYSDLGRACAPYLDDEEARRRIARNARTALEEALSADWFVQRFETVMQQAGVLAP